MPRHPHQPHQDDHSHNIKTKSTHNRIAIAPQASPTRLQTTNFDTPEVTGLIETNIEDNISPRTAVSSSFQKLELRNMSRVKRTIGTASFIIHEDSYSDSDNATEMISDDDEPTGRECYGALEIAETPEAREASVEIEDTTQDRVPETAPESNSNSFATSEITQGDTPYHTALSAPSFSAMSEIDEEEEPEPCVTYIMTNELAQDDEPRANNPSFSILNGSIPDKPEANNPSFSVCSESILDEQASATEHDMEHAMFEFQAGPASGTSTIPSHDPVSPSKRVYPAATDELPHSSPAKRRRQATPEDLEIQQTPPLSPTPIPRAQSPSARKLPNHKKRSSESSNDNDDVVMTDAEKKKLWWDDKEITGHDSQDPEEDNRGVNGVGYQKTREESWRLGQMRKKQIADFKARESKALREERMERNKERRTLMGRISKPSSRAGSPVEKRTRLSTLLTNAAEAGEQKSPKKAVTFRVG